MPTVLTPNERIGVILVHGIGEQRRFEHLEEHVRPLLEAIRRRQSAQWNSKVTLEILEAEASALHAEQPTWAAGPGPSLRATIVEGPPGKEVVKEVCFHEVWWADANEPYSLLKQIRFWVWGLSVWLYATVPPNLPGAAVMTMPTFPGQNADFVAVKVRAKLLLVANVFLTAGASLGALVFVLKRLFDFSAPSPIKVFVNYIGGVKLYNQRRRSGGGFLDAMDEPPRVSIRRRMIRALADVGSQDYTRWYVLAHSLGSVVAFNGLMENSHAFPNYLDQDRWQRLSGHFAGPAGPQYVVGGGTIGMIPARPVWLKPGDVVYRDVLFKRGLLTYGSPLDKFAAIWPKRVPINTGEPAFQPATEWINVYDPTDPVGAHLDAFTVASPAAPLKILTPTRNLGYRAHWMLLLSHIRYLRIGGPERKYLSDAIADWMLGGGLFATPVAATTTPWLAPMSSAERSRNAWTGLMWIIVYVLLTLLAAITLPHVWRALLSLATSLWNWIAA